MSDIAVSLTESVQVALIGTGGSIGLALIGGIFKAVSDTRKDAKATRYQVENDHELNLREDVDNKHNIVMGEIGSLNDRVTGHLNRFNNVDRRFDRMEDMLLHLIMGKEYSEND